MKRYHSRILSLSLLISLNGCSAHLFHVDLTVPGPSASLRERSITYRRFRPVSTRRTTLFSQGSYDVQTEMQLGGGKTVQFAEDILAAVPQDSVAATYARRSYAKRGAANTFSTAAVLSGLAAVCLLLFPIAESSRSESSFAGSPWHWGSVAAAGGLALGFTTGAILYKDDSERDAMTAYRDYDRALQQRLKICASSSCVDEIHDLSTEPSEPLRGPAQ